VQPNLHTTTAGEFARPSIEGAFALCIGYNFQVLLPQPSTATLGTMMYQGPHQHQHTPAYSNCFCYILVCNRQSICFMASEDFEKLRILSPTPSGPYIRPFITPSFVVHAPCIGALLLNSVDPALLAVSPACRCLQALLSGFRTFLPAHALCDFRHHSLHALITGRLQRPTDRPHRCLHLQGMFFREHDFPRLLSRPASRASLAQPARVPFRRLPVQIYRRLHKTALSSRPTSSRSPATGAFFCFRRSSSRPCAFFRPTSFRRSEVATVTIRELCLGAPPVQTASGQALLLPDYAS